MATNNNSVTTGIFESSELNGMKNMLADHKRRKQIKSDELLELNIRTEIELSENCVQILQVENLI